MTFTPPPKVLVTGASGYIGDPTTRALVASGCDVHVFGRQDSVIPGTTFHNVDLLQPADLRATIEATGTEILLHLAWSVTPGKFWTDPANTDWAAASLKLFRAFAEAGGQRIVGVGSCAEYDWSGSPLIEGTSPVNPGTLYGQAKASVWRLLEAMGQQEELSVAWARLFFLYGPGEPPGKLMADAVNALIEGRTLATTPGIQKRDFMYVEDAAEALCALTLSPTAGVVNIASGKSVAVRELLEYVAGATHATDLINFGARPLAEGEPMELVADISRLRDEVGFSPRFSLNEGVARTVAWWRQQSSTATHQS